MLKRAAVLFLAVLLVVGNYSFVSASATVNGETLQEKPQKKPGEKLGKTVDPDKDVRVIVEMEDLASIEKTTQKVVMFHSLQDNDKQQLQNEAKAKQQTVKSKRETNDIRATYLQEFTAGVNGFIAKVKQGDL